MIKLLTTILFLSLLVVSCAHTDYGTIDWTKIDPTKIKALINKGDKVIRKTIEPKEIEIPWDGVILSMVEYNRLRDLDIDDVIDTFTNSNLTVYSLHYNNH